MLSRFQILSTLGSIAVVALVATSTTSAQNMTTVRIASGLARPLFVTAPPGDTSRIFIVEQRSGSTGRVRIFDFGTNTLLATPYLSISPVATGNEQGLLGFAFDPNYATNGYTYVSYNNGAGTSVFARYTVMAGNPDVADPASAYPILSVAQPFSNHNGGWIGFGPDNDLYINLGDGGSEGDPNHIGQNMASLLSKQLRIDVTSDDFPADATKNYHIPANNPFVGMAGVVPEAWHVGLRNPWRGGFDRLTGDDWIGDVGQNTYEEIDFVPAGVGGKNFGWSCMEGFHCYGGGICTCNSPALTLPIQEYSHTGGACSVTGGYVYRGSAICGLQGTYFYADYCTAHIFSLRWNGTSVTNFTDRTTQLAPGGGLSINSITSFGEDASGEIYICDQGGEVFKIVPPPAIIDCNHNGIDDGCDIANNTSQDTNHDGIPDECQPSTTPYCFGDGSGAACPCGNNGSAGNGCANSIVASGGHLATSGISSLSNDSYILLGTGMPDSSCLYFQGTAQVNGGQGSAFGDGLRCAGGTVIRLATKVNSGGASQYPEILDIPISIKGLISGVPTTRTYQVWYRNAASFCMPETFNLTGAVSTVWGP